MSGSSARRLHQVRDVPVLQFLDALEREGRTRAIADEALAAFVVVGREAHRAVHVEAVARRGEALLSALVLLLATRFLRRVRCVRLADERAAPECEAREALDGRRRLRLVAAVFRGASVQVFVLAKPPKGALVDALRDVGDVRLLRLRGFVPAHGVAVLFEDAVNG
jgi:hypothetical protein